MGNRNGKFGLPHSHTNRTHRPSTHSSQRDVSRPLPSYFNKRHALTTKAFGLTKPSSG